MDRNKILDEKFFDRDPRVVAKDLIGKFLVRKYKNKIFVGIVAETESYLPEGDKASHSYKGKTKRNQSMFKSAGHLYIFSLRQYFLLNIVTEGETRPGAVLIRGLKRVKNILNKTDGPGKICRELKINRSLDGLKATNMNSCLYFTENNYMRLLESDIGVGLRVGISKSTNLPLRFFLKGK